MSGSTSTKAFEFEDRGRLVRAICLLFCVVAGGTIGFVVIERWDVWRALFFTLITITTVGYGDEGISDEGKQFASLLLVGGIGVASYTFALVVQTAVTRPVAWRDRMQKKIKQLSGHTIVCGFGRMGRAVCRQLTAAGVSLVVIERDPAVFEQACVAGHLALQGSSSDDELLVQAGIEEASHVVTVVSSEAENVFTALSARQLRPEIIIVARGEGDAEVRKLRLAGASRVVSPYGSGGQEVADVVVRPGVVDFLARSNGENGGVVLADIRVLEGSDLIGTSLAEYGRTHATQVAFVALQREGEALTIPPPGSSTLRAGDHLIVAGEAEQVARMGDSAGPRAAAA